MAKLNGFGHLGFSRVGFARIGFARIGFARIGFASTALAVVMLSACTTVPVPTGQYPQGPVVHRPPTGPVVTPDPTGVKDPKKNEEETKDPKETKDPTFEPGPYVNRRGGLTPPHMAGRDIKRMALLLPFSAKSSRLREEASSMMLAAEMAVFDREEPDVLLIALDTRGTASGARSATRAAVKSGVDVILGPILSASVKASASEARRSKTPLIAFSTDQKVAGSGTYLLSFPPEAEVKRIVDYAASTGATRYAFVGPQNEYGRRVKAAYEGAIRANGGEVTASEIYDGRDISVMQEPAKRLADFHHRGEEQAKQNGGETPMSYEAIMLPEGGTALRSLAPLLPYYDVDPADVQFLGTSLWKNDDTVREPALSGGIFAAADQDARQPFLDKYDRTYGDDPSRLASLAYDAVAVGAFVANGDPRLRRARAEDPSGFYGADGLVRFNPDGTPDRGLAVYQIKNSRFVIIDPAPRTVVGPS